MKKTGIGLLLFLLLQNIVMAKEYKKIDLNNNLDTNTKTSINTNNKNLTKAERIQLKSYNVSYDNFYKKYSIFTRNKKEAKKLLLKYKINPVFMRKFFNTIKNKKAVIMNAIIYDFYYKRPDLAENFYKLIDRGYPLSARILKSDFLVITGRPEKFNNLFNKVTCLAATNITRKCCYYLGLINYFNTANNKQTCLLSSGYKIGKDIYYNREK